MITWISGTVMVLSAFAAGLVQSVTGFGAGIVMMVFLPYFLSVTAGAAVSSLTCMPMQIALIWTYRKDIRWDYVWKPILFYAAASFLAVRFAVGKDMSFLKLIFGIFLVVLSLYFLFFAGKLKVKAGWPAAGVCGVLSGAASGLFGIGGPPMVVYYMALTGDEKRVYLGTIQMFFFITNIYVNLVRISSGIVTVNLLPFILAGTVGCLIGQRLGSRIVGRINADTMRKLVYAFMAFAGVVNMIGCL